MPQPANESYINASARAPPAAFKEAVSSKAMASRAASTPAFSMLMVFIGDQCTAWNSSSTLASCI